MERAGNSDRRLPQVNPRVRVWCFMGPHAGFGTHLAGEPHFCAYTVATQYKPTLLVEFPKSR